MLVLSFPFSFYPENKLQHEYIYICHWHSHASKVAAKKAICVRLNKHPQGGGGEVERVKKCSEEAALRASVLAFSKDNGSTESGLFHLHHREITMDGSNSLSPSPLTKTFIFSSEFKCFPQDLWLNIALLKIKGS